MASQTDKSEFRQLRDTIYTFFYYSNKPVSITEIILQFKNNKKSMVEKVLEDLVNKKMIFFRIFGKSKIYCLAQEMSFEIDESIYTDDIDKTQDQSIEDKVLRYLKWNFERHSSELAQLKDKNKKLDTELSEYDNQMTTEELKRAIKDFKATIKEYEGRDKKEVVSTVDFNKRKKEHAEIKKEFSKRSQLFKEIIDSLSEGLNKKRKELFKEIGLED